jgi:hypothetical protein
MSVAFAAASFLGRSRPYGVALLARVEAAHEDLSGPAIPCQPHVTDFKLARSVTPGEWSRKNWHPAHSRRRYCFNVMTATACERRVTRLPVRARGAGGP